MVCTLQYYILSKYFNVAIILSFLTHFLMDQILVCFVLPYNVFIKWFVYVGLYHQSSGSRLCLIKCHLGHLKAFDYQFNYQFTNIHSCRWMVWGNNLENWLYFTANKIFKIFLFILKCYWYCNYLLNKITFQQVYLLRSLIA